MTIKTPEAIAKVAELQSTFDTDRRLSPFFRGLVDLRRQVDARNSPKGDWAIRMAYNDNALIVESRIGRDKFKAFAAERGLPTRMDII